MGKATERVWCAGRNEYAAAVEASGGVDKIEALSR